MILLRDNDKEGMSKHNQKSKSKIEMIIIISLIGPWPKHVPLRFLGSVNEGVTYLAIGVKRPIDYPAQGNPCNALPPSERRDLWGVGTVYVCTLTDPLRFITWGTREKGF